MLHEYAGALVRRVVDPGRAVVREHAHDWPVISLYVLGGYRNVTEYGACDIAGPSLVYYRPGLAHRNAVGERGFEQIEIEFDPAWLGRAALPPEGLLLRVGGASGALARALACACEAPLAEARLRGALQRLLFTARSEPPRPPAAWAGAATTLLRADPSRPIGAMARELGRSPAWIGPAYRRALGEGLQQAAARFRIERAAQLLRESEASLAEIAAEAGFCDQSHMNRGFRSVLGRTPAAVRRDREAFRGEPGRAANGGRAWRD
ncbi:MAG TPA: AraC family transcriptional regulator [Nevskia sp.]|nr:AraC family transcriptional regulator [Nevskia sp.]